VKAKLPVCRKPLVFPDERQADKMVEAFAAALEKLLGKGWK
jgi:hypothetical protein